jgi:hypothetical protein
MFLPVKDSHPVLAVCIVVVGERRFSGRIVFAKTGVGHVVVPGFGRRHPQDAQEAPDAHPAGSLVAGFSGKDSERLTCAHGALLRALKENRPWATARCALMVRKPVAARLDN